MKRLTVLKSVLAGGASVVALVHPASAKVFDIPDGDLSIALSAYMQESGVGIVYVGDVVRGHRSRGVKGDYTETAALTQILRGTGFAAQAISSDTIGIVPAQSNQTNQNVEVAQVTPKKAQGPAATSSVETVVVTAQKKAEDIQQVPIAVTALSQKELTERQVAGGPDLVKEVPNLTFTKTNFTGYNLEIRGIGTQAISVTTDPAVAVALNGTPFIRNHFFEQEFYDVEDVEVLRGPQGTLFGRNATAGVVNLKSAQPTDQFEAMLSADLGNYNNRRFEGMVNIPIVSDKLDLRVAGEWTKRDGYTYDQTLGQSVDGRDLWSGRVSLGWKPVEGLQVDAVWEHFSEDDDRVRSAKQLCKKDPGPATVDGLDLTTLVDPPGTSYAPGLISNFARTWLSQGCLPTSLYSPSAFETPNGQVLPFVALGEFFVEIGDNATGGLLNPIDPYANQTQSPNLRVIQSLIKPTYRARNDTLELNADYALTPALTLTSQTAYNDDFLYSTEDFNRFDTAPGLFSNGFSTEGPYAGLVQPAPGGVYCDPQLGCSSSMIGEDLSQERATQFNQEFRITSSFKGPLNFSFGTNYTHYETVEDYYVFFNAISAEEQLFNGSQPPHYTYCHAGAGYSPVFPGYTWIPFPIPPKPYFVNLGAFDPSLQAFGRSGVNAVFGCGLISSLLGVDSGTYIDPNPLGQINGQGHNYFRSENPYDLNSYAGFGEVYYDVTPDLKFTGGLRWTDDRKVFYDIPSQTFLLGGGYPIEGVVKQGWNEWTGRTVLDWTPNLDFTDQTLIYASYAHGYKGGGANPPTPQVDFVSTQSSVTHPPTFAPEHIEAFELGTKNTALDGALTLNGDVFFYNYHGYQISQIVDRTSVNLNFNATVEGAELESTWEPIPGLKFNLAGGWEDSTVDKNQYAIDLMDRTAGNPNWVVVRPYVSETSNCILPASVVRQIIQADPQPDVFGDGLAGACDAAYNPSVVGAFQGHSTDQGVFAAAGFNPATAPNNGEGFFKNLSGNKLPNSPPFTLSTGAQYSLPVSTDWVATLRADFYWQGNTFARIFNDRPYDSIHGYTNLNLALILDSEDGWDVMAYVKNVFDVTAITGAFLNSDDTALTTNVFVTDPRLFGVRVTKHFGEGGGDGDDLETFLKNEFASLPPLWIELDGQWDQLENGKEPLYPAFLVASPFGSAPRVQESARSDWDRGVKLSFDLPESDWILSAAVRYGRSSRHESQNQLTAHATPTFGANYRAYQEFATNDSERHLILDFQAGKDVGLGLFGQSDTSTVGFGVRYTQFDTRSNGEVVSQPTNIRQTGNPAGYHHFYASLAAARKFTGVGPSLSWNASTPLVGNQSTEAIAFDWGLNGAMLFGRQKVRGHHETTNNLRTFNDGQASVAGGIVHQIYRNSNLMDRSRSVLVPNLGGFAGLSWNYSNAKVSLGYRVDEFLGAIDGGIDTHKSENRGFYGPFLGISIGLGGQR